MTGAFHASNLFSLIRRATSQRARSSNSTYGVVRAPHWRNFNLGLDALFRRVGKTARCTYLRGAMNGTRDFSFQIQMELESLSELREDCP